MVRALITNVRGEVEVDPFNTKGAFNAWLSSIKKLEGIDYAALTQNTPTHSEAIIRYLLDLAAGKNTAKGHRKGPRSPAHLLHVRNHLSMMFRILARETGKTDLSFSEDEVLAMFQGLRLGTIKSQRGTAYLDVSTYAKIFTAFWHWHVRTQKRLGLPVVDVVESLDTSRDHKPMWHHFTLKDVEKMADLAPRYEYKALIYFLFDSGIRAPKELMNVRAMDLAPIHNSSQYHLNIREETSKTFGRKIKLMLCADIIRKYVDENKLSGPDFLFQRSPIIYNRVLAKLGYKVLGIGTAHQQRLPNGQVHKTLVKHGITMYDFRHNSVCHYLPIYKSENQMKYRYGWKKSDMIHYYSEFLGMKDTIQEDDMLIDTTKTQLEQALVKEQQKVSILEERFTAEKTAMEERIQKLEATMLQRFANNY
jgi:hypothetical protein